MPVVLKNKYITTAKAETLSGVPARTIRWWFKTGKINGELIDARRLLVNIDDVLNHTNREKGNSVIQSTA